MLHAADFEDWRGGHQIKYSSQSLESGWTDRLLTYSRRGLALMLFSEWTLPQRITQSDPGTTCNEESS
jgi:hypothetical protein